MRNPIAIAAGFVLAIVAIAGFRAHPTRARDAWPKLTILNGAKLHTACGTGTSFSHLANLSGYRLKISTKDAMRAAEPELLKQGYVREERQNRLASFVRRRENGSVRVFFRDLPPEEPADVSIQVSLDNVTWFGIPVRAPFDF